MTRWSDQLSAAMYAEKVGVEEEVEVIVILEKFCSAVQVGA